MESHNLQQDHFIRLGIKGFRRLADVHLPLRRLCVMIGGNGAGKTSILDVLSLLASSSAGNLSKALSDLGGLPSVLTYERPEELELGIAMAVVGHQPLEYCLRIRPDKIAYRIEHESLTQQRKPHTPPFLHITARGPDVQYFDGQQSKLVPPNWEHDTVETALSQVPKMFREPEEFRRRLASSTFYHVLDVGPSSRVRLPQPLQPAALPGKNGEDLVSCLFNLQQVERHRFEAIEDALRAAFPRFDRLDFPPVAAGTLALTWREKGFSRPLYMHQLSEGTLRFLWLAALLQSPGLTALTLLDEPEVSLHPELLSLLAGLLREASRRTQIVVATHSDRLVSFLKPEEVLTLDMTDDGTAQLRWADQLDLEKWLAEYTLDELWRNGRLGARA